MAENDLLLLPDDNTREEHAYQAILKLYNSIVGCDRCENGILKDQKKIASVKDLVNGRSEKCSCFKLYEKYKSYILSGVPREFWKVGELNLDSESSERIELYLSKLRQVYEKGIGVLFLGSPQGVQTPNSGTGKTLSAIKILQEALILRKTVHYITMHSYFNLIYRSKGDTEDRFYERLIDEIDQVDFLCIDEVGKKQQTEYSYNRFEDVIRNRSSHLLVTMLITNMNEEELCEFVGPSLMDILRYNMIKITLIGGSFRRRRFIDIKKQLKWEI